MSVSLPPLRVTVMDDHFRAFLRGDGGVVHSVFSRAMNIRSGVGLVSVVCGDWPAPYTANIESAHPHEPFGCAVAGDAVVINHGGVVSVGDRVALDCSRARPFQAAFKRPGGCPDTAGGLAAFDAYCAANPFADGCAEFFRRHFLGMVDGTADRVAVELSNRLADFTTAVVERGVFETELWRVIGAGPGLTPSGDDFICGFLFALHNSGDPAASDVFSRMARVLGSRTLPTTDVGAQAIRASLDGESAAVFRELLEAFCGCRDMRAVMPKVRSVGHSSGMDFAVGMAAAFRMVLR